MLKYTLRAGVCIFLVLAGCKDKSAPTGETASSTPDSSTAKPSTPMIDASTVTPNPAGWFRDASVSPVEIVQSEPVAGPTATEWSRVTVTPDEPKTLDKDGWGVTEMKMTFRDEGVQSIKAELLATAAAFKPMAQATLDLNIDEDKTSSMLLEARLMTVEASRDYEFTVQAPNIPKGGKFDWVAFSEAGYRLDKTTTEPRVMLNFEHVGEWILTVYMTDNVYHHPVCQDQGKVTVIPSQNLIWREDKRPDGEVIRRWQELAGNTGIRQGQYLSYYNEALGQVNIKATYRNGRAIEATKYFENGTIEEVIQMDPNHAPDSSEAAELTSSVTDPGRAEGEYRSYYKDGRVCIKATCKKGLFDGPYEFHSYGIQDWLGHIDDDEIGRFEKGLRQGEWKFYGWSDGKRYLREECIYKDDLKDGPFKKYDWQEVCDLSGRYHQGELDGTITQYVHGKADSTVQYRDGKVVDWPGLTCHGFLLVSLSFGCIIMTNLQHSTKFEKRL